MYPRTSIMALSVGLLEQLSGGGRRPKGRARAGVGVIVLTLLCLVIMLQPATLLGGVQARHGEMRLALMDMASVGWPDLSDNQLESGDLESESMVSGEGGVAGSIYEGIKEHWQFLIVAGLFLVAIAIFVLRLNRKLHAAVERWKEKIVQQRRAEQALRESEAKFRAIAMTAQDAIIMMDNDGNVSYWNAAAEAMFGYEASEIVGKNLHNAVAPAEYHDVHRKAFARFRLTGQGAAVGKTLELYGLRKGGVRFPVELSMSSVQLQGKWCAVGIIRDISERKKAEAALKDLNATYKTFFETNPDGMLIIDSATREVIRANPAFCASLGYEQEVLEGIKISEVCPTDASRRFLCEFQGEVIGQKAHGKDIPLRRMDGTVIYADVNLVVAEIEQKKRIVVFCRNTTEERYLRAQLMQAQKLESIGQLAAGIAHEINTPTQYVGDNVSFLQDGFTDLNKLMSEYDNVLAEHQNGAIPPELIAKIRSVAQEVDVEYLRQEIPQAIVQAMEGIERISSIVRAMKQFAHPASKEKVATDINKAVKNTVTVSRNEWKYVAEMTTELDPDLPLVECLPGEINQVLLNIIVNAAHAIGDVVGDGSNGKGKITISTRQEGGMAEVRISDTGSGIPEEIRDRIFDPFFTTKEVGKGTGQGLAIARSIVVDKHGGTIDVQSEMGQGTTFVIRLPIRAKQKVDGEE